MLLPHLRFSLWDDRDGYAGYVPSACYFCGFYNMYLEWHAAEMDQNMSMLSTHILSIDHSFKVSNYTSIY